MNAVLFLGDAARYAGVPGDAWRNFGAVALCLLGAACLAAGARLLYRHPRHWHVHEHAERGTKERAGIRLG